MTTGPLSYLNEGTREDVWVMRCPVCGFTCTHVDDVAVLTPDGSGLFVRATGEDDGTHVLASPIAPDPATGKGRRHTIVLRGTCENGPHAFLITFRQHKGWTVVDVLDDEVEP